MASDQSAQALAALRQQLVATLRERGLLATDGVEAAFLAVPRHLFLPQVSPEKAYANRAVPIKWDADGLLISSASQPAMIAIMLAQAQLHPDDNVLEIGTATGYNAALMQHIVGAGGTITTIEYDQMLATLAAKNLRRARMSRVHVVHGDGAQGYAPRASYDHIVATVGVWDVPPPWLHQLKPGGSLIVPILVDGVQLSAVFRAEADGTFLSADNRPCSFVYLQGTHAGPSFRQQVGSSSLFILSEYVARIDTARLHALLSHDHEICNLESVLEEADYWYGFQIYLMLNTPADCTFVLYATIEGQTAYGLDSRGLGLITPGSAIFAAYADKGSAHCYGGSDAYLAMQDVLDEWNAQAQPTMQQMRLRLIPKAQGKPDIQRGTLYTRRDHYLHAWMET